MSAVDERLGERGGDSERGGEGSVAGGELGGSANVRGGERSVRGADTADFQRRVGMGGKDGGKKRPGRQDQQRGQR